MFSDKAARECRGGLIKCEVHRYDDIRAVLIAVEPCGLISVAIEPLAHGGHLTRKIRRG
jgi:hypothetical protein